MNIKGNTCGRIKETDVIILQGMQHWVEMKDDHWTTKYIWEHPLKGTLERGRDE